MFEVNGKVRERAILIGVAGPQASRWEIEDHLQELALLADTAGADVVEQMVQERKRFDPRYFIGKGKVDQLAERIAETGADLIIFDDDLSPAQAKNLESAFEIKVIDRSALILDIFARRAKTREARTQVELAQLRYFLPRLTRQWSHLSRQVGGIGTRGPGETQLEVDRRLIRTRIASLSAELQKIEKQRQLRRQHRRDIFKAALVGYTNVGKSTLMNALTASDVHIEDRLFATLDATVRALQLSSGEPILLIDTVGFIRKLPHHLIASFKSTLEEAREADVLVHVVDITHPLFETQISTVQRVLQDLQIGQAKVLYAFNKIDMLKNAGLIPAMKRKYAPAAFISASKGLFLHELVGHIEAVVAAEEKILQISLQASEGALIARVYEAAEVLEKEYEDEWVYLRVRASRKNAEKLTRYFKARGKKVEFLSA